MNDKTYLGDSVYATFDGNGLMLTTENGAFAAEDPSNEIYLESETYQALVDYVEKLRGRQR